jgi:hypothetical protein
MSKRILIIAALGFLCSTMMAQGLNWNQEQFMARERIEPSRDELPASASLAKYAPYTFLQHGSTCVAYSLANARTILWAKNNNVTDKDEITRNAFSPWFIYYRNKSADDADCSGGLLPEPAIEDVLNNGIAPLWDVEFDQYWPFTESVLTNWYPPDYTADVATAYQYKLDNAYRLETLADVKTSLALDMPILVGMYPPDSFGDLLDIETWTPSADELPNANNGHAMVIVAYDDNRNGGSVQILNSWSYQWGKDGYIWVSYDDFLRFTAGAYGLEANSEQQFSGGTQIFANTDSNAKIIAAQSDEPQSMAAKEFDMKGDAKDSAKMFKGLTK